MIEMCLQCDYPRTGLPEDAPCPECGTLPEPGACQVRGWKASFTPWLGSVAGGIMLLVSLFAFMSTWRVGFGQAVFGLIGASFIATDIARQRRRPHGGDLDWILTADGLQIRPSSGPSRRFEWDSIRGFRIRRGSILHRWTTIEVRLRFLAFAFEAPRLHLRGRHVDLEKFEIAATRWSKVLPNAGFQLY